MNKRKPKKNRIITKPSKDVNPSITIPTLVSNKILAFVAFVVLAISSGLYMQTLPYEYVLDDIIVITDNDFTQKGISGIPDLLFNESFVGYFKVQKDLIPGARYRPLSMISFAIEHQIMGGLSSKLSHFINVLLYAFAGWLLFYFLQLLFAVKQKKWYLSIAFLTTILWMTHATHSEAVANIKGRDEILSLLFSLICMICAVHYNDKRGKPWLMLLVGGLSFFLGLLSKENTITLG